MAKPSISKIEGNTKRRKGGAQEDEFFFHNLSLMLSFALPTRITCGSNKCDPPQTP